MFVCDGSPETRSLLAARPAPWTRAQAFSLSQPERDIWAAIGGGAEAWTAAGSAPGHDAALPFWWRVFLVAHAPASQFDALRDLLAAGLALPGPVACVALTGSGFHGQRGRRWVAAPGNLHVTAALCPERFPVRHGIALTMLPAVATVDAIRAVGGGDVDPRIKWVNDIVFGTAKVAGVLTATASQGEWLHDAVFGIGLNVEHAPEVPPTPFTPAIVCLRDASKSGVFTLSRMLQATLDAMADRLESVIRGGPSTLFEVYRKASMIVGRRVRIWEEGMDDLLPPASWPPPIAEGVVEEIGPDLSLRLEGRADSIDKGRLALQEACLGFGI